MTRAQNGQIMTLDEALALQDRNGEDIKWVKNDDGSYFSELTVKDSKKDMEGADKEKQPAEFKYFYSVTPKPQVAEVSVVRQRVDRNIPLEIERRSLGLDAKDPEGPIHIAPINPEIENDSQRKEREDKEGSYVKSKSPEDIKKEQDKKAGKWIDEKEYKKLNK